MSKLVRVFIEFTFEPDGHDESMFEGMSPTNIERMMRDLVVEDITRLAYNGELHQALTVMEDN